MAGRKSIGCRRTDEIGDHEVQSRILGEDGLISRVSDVSRRMGKRGREEAGGVERTKRRKAENLVRVKKHMHHKNRPVVAQGFDFTAAGSRVNAKNHAQNRTACQT